MNFTNNLVLKENYTFLVAGSDGMVRSGEHGLYNRDTRFMNQYYWNFGTDMSLLVSESPRTDLLFAHHSLISGAEQLLGVRRSLQLSATGLHDRLQIANTSLEPQEIVLRLHYACDLKDLFEVRGWHQLDSAVQTTVNEKGVVADHRSTDGLCQSLTLRFSHQPSPVDETSATFRLALAPGAEVTLTVRGEISSPLEDALPLPERSAWRSDFPDFRTASRLGPVIEQAITDLRGLLLATAEGPVAAAGIPWFVTTFGRDSLITASMLVRWQPDLARGTLRHLAARQGRIQDEFRSEQPGKILHELRQGVLARTGVVPFGRYYGSIDSTMLFMMLLAQLGDQDLVRELEPNWLAALHWLEEYADADSDGFYEFTGAASGQGLSVQSWKDSHDSLSFEDGSLAQGAIAVCEVQGYAYAALKAAEVFFAELGAADQSTKYRGIAARLQEQFHQRFWIPELETFALALDGDKRPLKVRSSDAGQLLWSGIVKEEYAGRLVESLFREDMWSGWGFRTLSTREVRYNPVSYHNGSVWPHDTALIGLGMQRYGFEDEAGVVQRALLDLAASQPDRRAPELISGYARDERAPVPYPVACRPQAWSAAALLALLPDGDIP